MPVLVVGALWAAYTGFGVENSAWFCVASQFRDPFQRRTMRRALGLLAASLAATVVYFFLMATVSIATTT